MRYLGVVFFLISAKAIGQKAFDNAGISVPVKNIVKKIEAIDEVMDRAVYYAGTKPKQYNFFVELRKKANQQELISLTNHPNGVVRCYSFWALAYDTTINLFPIVLDHINDTVRVKTQFGCIGSRVMVGDFFIDIVTPSYVDLGVKKLSKKDLLTLDSILFFTKNWLSAKEDVINKVTLNEQTYIRVKELFLQENNQNALVALSKFQKKEDIPLIISNTKGNKSDDKFYTFKAIREFPDPAFWELLTESANLTLKGKGYSAECRQLYNAIASYKNDSARLLLEKPFMLERNNDTRQYHLGYISGAIQDNYTNKYDSLLWKLWQEDKIINPWSFNLFYFKDWRRSFEMTKENVWNGDKLYSLFSIPYDVNKGKQISLLDVMLDTIVKYDSQFAELAINKGIRMADVHSFKSFSDKACMLGYASFANSFLERISEEDNTYVYLEAANSLLSYQSISINKKLADIIRKRKKLYKDWGKKELIQLLNKNHIDVF